MLLLSRACPICSKQTVVYDNGTLHCTSCSVYWAKPNFFEGATLWARANRGWWRIIILLVMGYWLLKFMGSSDYILNRLSNPFDALDFGIHELGHILFIPFGEFMTIAGGSIFQCLFSLIWLAVCIWKRWYFAGCMMLVWFSYNLFDVAMYAADARARLLPLATFSSDYDSAHDWYQLLSRTGHLSADTSIAAGMRIVGKVCGFAGLMAGGYLVLVMFWSWFSNIGAKQSKHLS